MKYVKLPKQNLSTFVESLKSNGKVYGPVKNGSSYFFQEINDSLKMDLNYSRTMIPPKKFFLKLKEREAFDFAIVSVAVNLTVKSGNVADSRVILGGVAPFPFRSSKAETVLKGNEIREAAKAACSAVTEGAKPLNNNAYKLTAAKGLLEKALALMS